MRWLDIEFEDELVMVGDADGHVTFLVALKIEGRRYLLPYDYAGDLGRKLVEKGHEGFEQSIKFNGNLGDVPGYD